MQNQENSNIPSDDETGGGRLETIVIHASGLMRDGLLLALESSQFRVVHSGAFLEEETLAPASAEKLRVMLIAASKNLEETAAQIQRFKQGRRERFAAVLIERESFGFEEAALLLNAGANALLSGSMTADVLIKCLDMVVLGELVVSQQFMQAILGTETSASSARHAKLFEEMDPSAGYIIIPDRRTG